jgi:hypothetical protein
LRGETKIRPQENPSRLVKKRKNFMTLQIIFPAVKAKINRRRELGGKRKSRDDFQGQLSAGKKKTPEKKYGEANWFMPHGRIFSASSLLAPPTELFLAKNQINFCRCQSLVISFST